MRIIFLLLFICTISFQGMAQINVKGKSPYNLKTMVFPGHNYRIKIDGELQPAVNLFTVPPGKHYIEIWAPHYKRFDTALYFSSKLTVLPVILDKSDELVAYEEAYEKSKKHLRATASSVGGFLLATGIAYYNYNRIGDLNVDKIKAENGFDHGLTQYTEGEKNSSRRKLTNARIMQGFIYAGIGALGYNAVRHYLKAQKIVVPKLEEDKSFIVDAGFMYLPDGSWQTGLVIKF